MKFIEKFPAFYTWNMILIKMLKFKLIQIKFAIHNE